jgi:fibronectin type 3 domain-containing protein
MGRILLVIPFLLFFSTAEAAYVDLAWSPNGEADLGGYRVYYGIESGEYIRSVDVGKATSYRLDNLLDDVTYFIALTAYDRAGNESDFSEEVSAVGVPGESESPPVEYADAEGGCFVSTSLRHRL